MAVTIQDDMLLAASQMSKKDGDAFLLALLAYGATGAEPKGKPVWLPTFTTCKERINMSEAKRKKAKEMAESRWGKQDAAADAQASCTSIMHTDTPQGASTRSIHKDTPQGDSTRSVHKDTPEMSRDEVSSVAVRSDETHARAQEWCMEEFQTGYRVLDNRDEGHNEPAESLLATYESVHGSGAGFERVRRAMSRPACEGCDHSEDRIVQCHNVTRDALVRWDRPLDGDPSRIIGKMLREDVDNYG